VNGGTARNGVVDPGGADQQDATVGHVVVEVDAQFGMAGVPAVERAPPEFGAVERDEDDLAVAALWVAVIEEGEVDALQVVVADGDGPGATEGDRRSCRGGRRGGRRGCLAGHLTAIFAGNEHTNQEGHGRDHRDAEGQADTLRAHGGILSDQWANGYAGPARDQGSVISGTAGLGRTRAGSPGPRTSPRRRPRGAIAVIESSFDAERDLAPAVTVTTRDPATGKPGPSETIDIADPDDRIGTGLFCRDWLVPAQLACGRSGGGPVAISLHEGSFTPLPGAHGAIPTVIHSN
jgi:hypothetical protein